MKVVTGLELVRGKAILNLPFGDVLAKIGAKLTRLQLEADALETKLEAIKSQGVFLDEDGAPVVPSWWERKQDGRDAGWYLIWPADYAKRAGRKRREPIKSTDYQVARAKVWRTLTFAKLKEKQDKIIARIDSFGAALSRLATEMDAPGTNQVQSE